MHAVSCEIKARSENELSEGIYPSAIAHRLRPMASMARAPPLSPETLTRKLRFSLQAAGTFLRLRRRRRSILRGRANRDIRLEEMRAITVSPGIPESARLDAVREPPAADGAVL